MRKPKLGFTVAILMGLLCACGGGVSTTPSAAPSTQAAAMTSAQGVVVEDSNDKPIGGAQVSLSPWVRGATPIPEATSAPDGTFSFAAKPGHYLLNIHLDAAHTDVHDNVKLAGGQQMLKASALPLVPDYTPTPAERSGNYRLATLDPVTEVPCLQDYNAVRISRGENPVVADEWLTENVRADIAEEEQHPVHWVVPIIISSGYFELTATGIWIFSRIRPDSTPAPSSCTTIVNDSVEAHEDFMGAADTIWFGGKAIPSAQIGITEVARDPRDGYTDAIPWPQRIPFSY